VGLGYYDNNGNQTRLSSVSGGTTSITDNTFDKFNQLTQTVLPSSAVISYAYNGEGKRISKTAAGQTTRFLFEGDKVILELDGAGNTFAVNVQGTSLISRTTGGQTAYYMYNGHGDATALLSSAGSILGTYYFDAFGVLTESTGTFNNPYTYAGYQYDKETGIYYLQSRMYDPVIARFLQEDTYRGKANDPLSLNLYTYCHNEPLMYTDPLGHTEACDVNLSPNDQARIAKLTNDYYAAKAAGNTQAMDDAHRAAAAIRETGGLAGYSKTDKYNYSSKKKTGSGSSLNKGSSGQSVAIVQNALKSQGYSIGTWGADGSFGTYTEAAVIRYQIDHGLYYDGIVGKKTSGGLGISLPTKPTSAISNRIPSSNLLFMTSNYQYNSNIAAGMIPDFIEVIGVSGKGYFTYKLNNQTKPVNIGAGTFQKQIKSDIILMEKDMNNITKFGRYAGVAAIVGNTATDLNKGNHNADTTIVVDAAYGATNLGASAVGAAIGSFGGPVGASAGALIAGAAYNWKTEKYVEGIKEDFDNWNPRSRPAK